MAAVNSPAKTMGSTPGDYDAVDEDYGSAESDSLLQAKQKEASVTFSGNMEGMEAPPDRYWKVYIIFYIFGMCSVLPWNMFITANTYFDHKLRNTTTENSNSSKPVEPTQLQTMFESYFSVASQVPNVVVQILNTAFKHKVTLQIRILSSLSGMLILFIVTTILTQIPTDDWQVVFFYATLVSVIIINSCGAVFQGSVFGLAGVLPKNYTQAVMAGQGLGGILPALISIITIAAIPYPSWSGFVYFLCAVFAIIVTIVSYFILPRLEFAEYYLNKQNLHLGLDPNGSFFGGGVGLYTSEQSNIHRELISSTSFEVKTTKTPPFLLIFKKIWLPALLVMFVFLVTLGLFPGATSQIQPFNWNSQYFTPVVCFLLFNTMDFTGRVLSGVIQWPSDKQMWILTILVILRIGFFPLFGFCNIQPDKRSSAVYFTHDAYPVSFMVIFALSNGYLGSLAMMYGPKKVNSEDHMETAGQMMALFLVLGLGAGSLLSVPFIEII